MSRRADRRRIFAKRYKTELCTAFMETGECTFAHKCVFAHGAGELRTEEQNVADGLTSDEIVEHIAAGKPAPLPKHSSATPPAPATPTVAAAAVGPTLLPLDVHTAPNTPSPAATPSPIAMALTRASSRSSSSALSGASGSPRSTAAEPRVRRHDPYAPLPKP